MSYDLSLFAAKAIVLDLPNLSSVGWLEVSEPMEVEPDDLSESELAVVGKRRFNWQIHLSNQTSEQDWALIEAWLSKIIVATKGVVIDPQNGTYQTASRRGQLRRDAKLPRDPSWLCFWFKDGEGFHAHGFAKFLETLAELLPEALPRRFGDYEPLQGKVNGSDYEPLLAAFADNPSLLLAASPPFGEILLSIPCAKTFLSFHPRHPMRRHFLLACLKIKVGAVFMEGSRSHDRLISLFNRLCVQMNVVYGEFTAPLSSPWGSWLWDGLPDRGARAICIGEEYRRVWPEAERSGRELGSHHRLFVAARDGTGVPRPGPALRSPTSIPLEMGDVADITALNRNLHEAQSLARVFPFDYVYSPDRYIW